MPKRLALIPLKFKLQLFIAYVNAMENLEHNVISCKHLSQNNIRPLISERDQFTQLKQKQKCPKYLKIMTKGVA